LRLSAFAAELEGERVAHRIEIEAVGRDVRRGLDDDLVDVAHQLQPLIEVLAVEIEALFEIAGT